MEKFFGNMHIVHLQNIEKNGRIVICNGGKEIFFLCLLHYNDTCKVNQQFTGGEREVIKLNILNMKNFQNKNCLCLILEIPNPTDYMNIVSYYAGDC